MNAFIIQLENRPGTLADLLEAIAERGINITAGAATAIGASGGFVLVGNDEQGIRSVLDAKGATYAQTPLVVASLEDRPGTMADAARRLANAGVNITAIFATGMDGGRISVAFGVDNVDAARGALGELAAATA